LVTSGLAKSCLARARLTPWSAHPATSRPSCAKASPTTTKAMSGVSDASSTKCAR